MKNGAIAAHPPSSIPFLALGAWILTVGWFGFNVMSAQALDKMNGLVAVNSLMAMVGGTLVALLMGKNDPGFAYNGPLAGLVAVCAGSDLMHPLGALATGAIAGGVFVWMFTLAQNKWKIDDVLGVWPLHGLCGAWGGIAAGIFGQKALGGIGGVSLAAQLGGTLLGVAIALIGGFAIYGLLKATLGLRLDPEEEFQGPTCRSTASHRLRSGSRIGNQLTVYHHQQRLRLGLADVADDVLLVTRVARRAAQLDLLLVGSHFHFHRTVQQRQVFLRARIMSLRGQFAARHQRQFIPLIFARQFQRAQDAQHVAGVMAGQGRNFVRLDHADGLRLPFGRCQQFPDLHSQRIGQPPGDGDGRVGLLALDLRQHRLGDPRDPGQVFQGQAARQAQPLQGGADFRWGVCRNRCFHCFIRQMD